MLSQILQRLAALELEEKILNASALAAVCCLFLPWFAGEWLGGETAAYNAFGFYSSFIGFGIFGLLSFVLLITFVPLTGGPILVRKRHREMVRLIACSQATILMLATLSVLQRVTFEFSRMEVRFGIYFALVGSAVATLYAFLRVQEQRRQQVQELFHHPEEDSALPAAVEEALKPPPPPPPPAPEPEEHRLLVGSHRER